MKFLDSISPKTRKLFVVYFFIFTFGIFFTVSVVFSNQKKSSIWDDYTSLAPKLKVENGEIKTSSVSNVSKENWSLVNEKDSWSWETTNLTSHSQLISPSEVVTAETVSKIRTQNLNSAPRKRKIEEEWWGIVSVSSEPPRYEFRLYASQSQANRLKRLLEKVVVSSKFHDKVTPLAVDIVEDRTEPRGRMTMDSVSVIVSIPSESESLRVFVHELWHVIDIHYLQEWTFWKDPSEYFYTISWKDHQTKKPGQSYENFVSGYAMTNKYEDFAESFSEYVFANENFRAIAKKNPVLQKKYDFFKNRLFQDEEFIGTDFETEERKAYIWDTTKMSIAVNKYLYYIK